MASITIGGAPVETSGNLPAVGSTAPDFKLVKVDLTTAMLQDYRGSKVVLNIFPSVGTGVCANSVRQFNQEAAELENTHVLCISRDLPFAQKEFCAAEGIENVEMLSDFRDGSFGRDYGVVYLGSKFEGLLSRSVVVVDENGTVLYTEQVPETGQEPNYKAALDALYNG